MTQQLTQKKEIEISIIPINWLYPVRSEPNGAFSGGLKPPHGDFFETFLAHSLTAILSFLLSLHLMFNVKKCKTQLFLHK
jgi:hypothetical protein